MTRAILAVLLPLILVACGGGGGGGDGVTGATPRTFMRQDSAVTVVPNLSGGFTATKVVTLSNDDAGASRGDVDLINVAGSIASSASSGGYQVQVTLAADADTDAQARAALASMSVLHADAVGGDTLYLGNEVRFGSDPGSDNRTASVVATLPGTLAYRLYQTLAAGANGSSGLHGPLAQVDSASGTASLSGTWDAADINAGAGTVTVSGDIADLQASSQSGTVQATLAGTRNTQALLDSTSGSVDVAVTQGVNTGFDLDAQTTSGTATIIVAGTVPEGAQSPTHAHFRSVNYESRDPKVNVRARSVSGSVNIHD